MAGTTLVYPYELEGGKKAVASEVMSNFYAIQTAMAGVNTEINSLTKVLTELKEKPTSEMMNVLYRFEAVAPTGAFPLWTGQTLTNAKTLYPEFWKKLNDMADKGQIKTVADNAAYEAKLKQFGQCASFYIDKLNGHIRLPKVTRFISSISDLNEIGEYNDKFAKHNHAELQTVRSAVGSKNGVWDSTWVGSKKYDVRGRRDTNGDWYNDDYTAGEGNETMPKHIRLYLYLQVVNNTAEISRFDVDALAEALNQALESLKKEYEKYALKLENDFKRLAEEVDFDDYYTKEEVDVLLGNMSGERFAATFSVWQDRGDYDGEFVKKSSVSVTLVKDLPVKEMEVLFAENDAISGNFSPVCDWSVAENNQATVTIYAKAQPSSNVSADILVIR